MMKVSEALGGIGSEAISAVPVFEKTKATCGKRLIVFSTSNCIACDWESAVPGMRSACMAMFFSSSVGMNSWPSRVNSRSRRAQARAPRDHRQRGLNARLNAGAYSAFKPRTARSPVPARGR